MDSGFNVSRYPNCWNPKITYISNSENMTGIPCDYPVTLSPVNIVIVPTKCISVPNTMTSGLSIVTYMSGISLFPTVLFCTIRPVITLKLKKLGTCLTDIQKNLTHKPYLRSV
jgi:hypothetical protein